MNKPMIEIDTDSHFPDKNGYGFSLLPIIYMECRNYSKRKEYTLVFGWLFWSADISWENSK